MQANLIAIDWGSSKFRAYLTNDNAEILDRYSSDCGMLKLKPNEFASVLRRELGGWLERYPNIPILMAGMVGSKQGWHEASYIDCPASLHDLSKHLFSVEFELGREVFIVPGLAMRDPVFADVMRGEETQLFGAMQIDNTNQVVCLPGTHSKWVSVHNQIVQSFRTFLTGEMYALLTKHSILSKVSVEQVFDEIAFLQGVYRARDSKGLLTDLFKVRALSLLDFMSQDSAHSYLSGLLVGYEIIGVDDYLDIAEERAVHVVADPLIAQRYLLAFAELGYCRGQAVDPDKAIVRGLVSIYEGR